MRENMQKTGLKTPIICICYY